MLTSTSPLALPLSPAHRCQAGVAAAGVSLGAAYLGLWLLGFDDVYERLLRRQLLKPEVVEKRLGRVSDLWSRTEKLLLLTLWQVDQEPMGVNHALSAVLCCCRRRRRGPGRAEADVQAEALQCDEVPMEQAERQKQLAEDDTAAPRKQEEEVGRQTEPVEKEAKASWREEEEEAERQTKLAEEEAAAPRKEEEPDDATHAEVFPFSAESSVPLPASTAQGNIEVEEQSCPQPGSPASLQDSDTDPVDSSWTAAFDAGSIFCDLEVYVHHFCPTQQGFCAEAAERLAEDGARLWRMASGTSSPSRPAQPSSMHGGGLPVHDMVEVFRTVNADPGRTVSSLVWALMQQALRQSKGFEQGTFVVHGPGAEEVFFALLPHTYDRNSSHFAKTVIWLTVQARASRGSSHVGLDVHANGKNDLPAGKQHVVLGRIRQHDGSVAVYMKPEDHGFDLSAGKMGEAALHAVSYITSQVQRKFGDRREHDEGVLKRKEYVAVEDKARFDQLLLALRCACTDGEFGSGVEEDLPFLPLTEQPEPSRLRCYGLGEMARTLRKAALAAPAGPCRDEAFMLLQKWETTYGPALEFQRGREVLIHTSCFSAT
eukprot:TRINITY_DN25869_c0_g1_i2.p1 TRINITY_DN25869_c0_g1~~TRINITY_DN25869_c0_g1_i2.p1  ORF type:complete len:598 (+),score=141.28 TRINITY_DN25869_c0_g1_i2:83-1876(+)